MFGYVRPVVPDLYVREFELYKAIYCGICREMKKKTGRLTTLTLSYDMVFLTLVRMALLKEQPKLCRRRCSVNPFRGKQMICDSPSIEYAARASALLTLHKLRDDRSDERGGRRLAAALALPYAKRAAKRASLPELDAAISKEMTMLSELEASGCDSVDEVANCFGRLLGEVFSYGFSGPDSDDLYDIGFYLGRFIYVADAADDLNDDRLRGRYNPLAIVYGEDFDKEANRRQVYGGLISSASAAEEALRSLSLTDADAAVNILTNILRRGLPMKVGHLIGEGISEGAFPAEEKHRCKNCGACSGRA